MEFKAVPAGMAAFTAADNDAAVKISSAGSADTAAMLYAAADALGPMGAAISAFIREPKPTISRPPGF